MPPADAITTAHEYLRVSTTKQRSNPEQAADNAAARAAHGWASGRTYADVGSASRYSRKKRADFDQLVADLRAGLFARGDVLILWESSRGSRRQSEWATLLDLLDDHGVKVHVTTHNRTYDLSNPRDRRTLDEDGTDSAYESGKTSMRIKRSVATNAAAGRPHGRVPFGYVRMYDPATGKLAGQELDPERAPIIRELFDRLEKGHSLKSLARDFAERGIVGRESGKPITEPQWRNVALRAAYAGLRESKTAGQAVKAIWPEIVEPRQYYAVKRILTDPSRLTSRPGRGKWLLSMIGTCAVCNGPLSVALSSCPAPRYRCHAASHVKIDLQELDEVAEQAILGYLNRDEVLAALRAAWGQEDQRLAKIRADLEQARGELADLGAKLGAGTLSADLAAAAEPGIKRRITALEKQETELSTPAILRGLVGVGLTLKQWRDKPMSTRREVARMLFAPEFLGTLAVGRASDIHRITFLTQNGAVYRHEPGTPTVPFDFTRRNA